MRTVTEATTPRRAFIDGIVAVAPILVGVIPFGLIAGVATREAGYGVAEVIGFSVVVFAGASQLAAVELLGGGASIAVAIFTAWVINLRMVLYSASLAVLFRHEPLRRRVAASYLMTDQAYAVTVANPDAPHRWAYYMGAAVTLWVVWQPTTVVGVLIGDVVPEAIPLGFAVPVAFISILIPTIRSRPTLAAALTAAAVAVAGVGLPANLGMPLAIVAGVGVGWVAARRGPATPSQDPTDDPAAPGGP